MPTDPLFSALDLHFARFLTSRSGLAGKEAEGFERLLRELSAAMSSGHSCLQLESEDVQLLTKTPLVSATIESPLVLSQDRLYLQRYFRYESRLARQLKDKAAIRLPLPDLEAELAACFGTDGDNLQRRAAELALTRPLALISGGPGTGKTATVARILGLLLSVPGAAPRIALAAPTGKAAMRLKESITASLPTLALPPAITGQIPTAASTLHRLLGARPHSAFFRHHQDNPLPWDVVVVDEASMVDLALMSKLVDALRPLAHLILLGDKDQLASVESGAVLADCIAALPDNTVILQKSYRFNLAISTLAQAVNQGQAHNAWDMLAGKEEGTARKGQQEKADREHVTGHSLTTEKRELGILQEGPTPFIVDRSARFLQQALACDSRSSEDLRRLFRALNSFRALCATRQGPGGAETINHEVERGLAAAGFPCQAGDWYPGRPVILQRNDYTLNLFNGDVGICLPDSTDEQRLLVWFEQGDGVFSPFHPGRLPTCETVFAMTIHKSQGSEFTEALVILPPTDTPLLTRELLYTAITRARDSVLLSSNREIFTQAVNRTTSRTSGLYAMLTACSPNK